VVPVLVAYALVVSIVAYAARHPDAGRRSTNAPPIGARIRLVGLTVVGGYCSFLAIVLVFHVWLVGDRTAMRSALGGGAVLSVITAAVFVVAELAAGR
jgi:Na+/citrate or Na+/malate symporter